MALTPKKAAAHLALHLLELEGYDVESCIEQALTDSEDPGWKVTTKRTEKVTEAYGKLTKSFRDRLNNLIAGEGGSDE